MKYLLMPFHLIEFWYPEGLACFIRTWNNLMLFLEEDLAVGLMMKLIFTPLFHDSTIVGLILSFLFRLTRILIGLFAFTLASIALFGIAIYWFGLPVLAFLNIPEYLSVTLFLTGLGLFLIHIAAHPHKKVWQIKDSTANFWLASTIKKEKISFVNLLNNRQVQDLLTNLELQPGNFSNLQIINIDKTGQKAFELAKNSGSPYIGPRHFFVAALEEIPGIDNLLLKLDLKIADFKQTLNFLEKKNQTWRRVYVWDDDFTVHHLKGVNRGWLGVPTPTLDLYGDDLTKKAAKEGFPQLIREKTVVSEVINILSQQTGKNVILVGPPGSGKTALIKHLAKQIVTGDAPATLATKRLVLLDLTKLLSGVKTQGELAERVKSVFEEISFAQNVIIVIEEIHELGMGEVGTSFNLYSLMQPYLEEDNFQFIGTTEAESYSRILEKNGSFARLFRKIELEPASVLDTLRILEDRAIEAERKQKVKVTFVALTAALELATKFVKDRVLPDSAISVLKESFTESVNGWVTKNVVKRVVSSRVRVPLIDIGNADKNKLLNLEEELHLQLVDQEQAVKSVSDALRRAATGLKEDGRPIGSFLFVGPTGVGKTELAKALAAAYFKTDGAFIRFDMSEYQNPESVSRLIGGLGEGGLLTESIRSRPYALILLDEFEKAHEKILTLFLQVLDDGRLTDGTGRTISFENTIIIATSNAGSLLIARGLQQGKGIEAIDRQVNDEILKIFKPELVNRFDDVVIFKPLSQEDLEKIVKLKLNKLQDQLKIKGYLIDFDTTLVAELAKKGFDPILGARPLRRLIQDTLEARFSKLILQNQLIKGQTFQAGVELL